MNEFDMIPVVIADDESSIRNGLLSAIPWADLHMKVMGSAKDGIEAWELIQAVRPSIVITDIRMPGLSGLDLIKRVRDSQLDIHFIILSGYHDFSYAQTAIRYGARAYVLKPLKKDELMAELEGLREETEKQKNLIFSPAPIDLFSFRELSRKMFLNQLVNNEFHHRSDIVERIQELQIDLTEGPYQIIVYSLLPSSEEKLPDTLARAKEILTLSATGLKAHIWENEKNILCMLLPLEDRPDTNSAHPVVSHCLNDLSMIENCQVLAAIGTTEQELLMAGSSYHMALTALSYRLFESGQSLFDQTVICTQPPNISGNSIDNQKLLTAIQKNERKVIESYCRTFFDSLLYVSMPPPSFIRGMAIYLVTDIQNALRKQMGDEADMFSELPYLKINQLATLSQIIEWCTDLFLKYAAKASCHVASRKDYIILQAKQFIREHMNQKIQAEDVAAVVNFSPAYFTIYFKTKTGVNFRDYILNVKMEHAKHLLDTQDANISEISSAVGYEDYRSFYRAFKNYTGMTPSEYQTKHQS